MPLSHFCDLISPPAKFRLRRSYSERPLTRIHTASQRTGFMRVTTPPVSTSPNNPAFWPAWIGSKEGCPLPAPVVAAPARITRHAASAVCSRLAISNAGFPPWRFSSLASARYPLSRRDTGQTPKLAMSADFRLLVAHHLSLPYLSIAISSGSFKEHHDVPL